jgi:hypothetical protein
MADSTERRLLDIITEPMGYADIEKRAHVRSANPFYLSICLMRLVNQRLLNFTQTSKKYSPVRKRRG